MKIAVVGASGRTGLQVVERAAARGHEVVAVVRNPAKLASLTTAAAEVAKADAGDVASQADAFRALGGVDAVVFAIGSEPSRKADHTIMRTGIATTIAAMDEARVGRLVAVSASGISTDGDGFFMRTIAKPIVQSILTANFADMTAMEARIRASELDWTIVRPPQLTNKDAKGRYAYRITSNPPGGRITRADLADAILDALDDRARTHEGIPSSEETRRAVLCVAN
jgi:putative NADH-flavin reductase